jgi:hypothetical protein
MSDKAVIDGQVQLPELNDLVSLLEEQLKVSDVSGPGDLKSKIRIFNEFIESYGLSGDRLVEFGKEFAVGLGSVIGGNLSEENSNRVLKDFIIVEIVGKELIDTNLFRLFRDLPPAENITLESLLQLLKETQAELLTDVKIGHLISEDLIEGVSTRFILEAYLPIDARLRLMVDATKRYTDLITVVDMHCASLALTGHGSSRELDDEILNVMVKDFIREAMIKTKANPTELDLRDVLAELTPHDGLAFCLKFSETLCDAVSALRASKSDLKKLMKAIQKHSSTQQREANGVKSFLPQTNTGTTRTSIIPGVER